MQSSELIGSRYEVEALLGRGGAGEVYRVHDRVAGKPVALKRLRGAVSAAKAADLALLFEREYHALAELAHPCIIEVYDYGVADSAAYYTMELLDGRDLYERSPLPWREACALLIDVASSLALLHSRRRVHRDLSPRNVRCTGDGRAKLIDFGAMASMGVSRQLIGTPGYASPELVNGQELDGRADLYGLGALAYWTLTGRHAFRARKFAELRDLWRTRPAPPSAFVRNIPLDLDALVMALLAFDPGSRPSTATEVIRRLRALAGLADGDAIESAGAYLTTPTLIGRDEAQRGFRRSMLRMVRGEGHALLIEGVAGAGRSRLLATLVLEAKLAGAMVLAVNGSASSAQDYALLRKLVDGLLELAPELTRRTAQPQLPLLRAVLPQLAPAQAADAAAAAAASPLPDEGELREALVDWFGAIARYQPLCIAVDDLPRADAQSAAFLARLGARAHTQRIAVAATAESEANQPLARALVQIGEAGEHVRIAPLDAEQITALLRSVFGAVPHLAPVAAWIGALSGGRPGSCMELAQHLVDRKIAQFADGAWTLPYKLEGLSLPSSFEQALAERYAGLSACARALCELLSLVIPLLPPKLADYLELLSPSYTNRELFQAFDELQRAQLLIQVGEGHTLRDATLRSIVGRGLDPERLRALHARLAQHYEQRGGAEAFVAYHLLHSGDFKRGFALHRTIHGRITDISSHNALFGRSEAGVAVLESFYRAGRERGLSPAQLYPLQKVLIQLAAVSQPELLRYAPDVLPGLRRDSGLIYWDDLAALSPMDRVVGCLSRAQQCYDATPEDQRGLAPLDAVRELAVTAAILSGAFSRTSDSGSLAQLPDLLAPFVPLAPVMKLLHELVVGTVEGAVHATDVRADRQRIIDELARPVDGLDEMTRQGALHLLSYYQALDEAVRASPQCLARADVLERLPSYAPLAWEIRMLYYQSAGDVSAAARAREQRESLSLRDFEGDSHLTGSLMYEGVVVLRSGDLVAAQRLVDRMAREAQRFPGWRLWQAHAEATLAAMRNDLPAALAAVERCLSLAPTVGHAACVEVTGLRIDLLARSGEHVRAVELGRQWFARRAAENRPLNNVHPVALALALAEALSGDHASAAARADHVLAEQAAESCGDLQMAIAHAQRARIALCAGDQVGFEQHAALAGAISERLRHPGLIARLQQLIADARGVDQPVSEQLARSADLTWFEGPREVVHSALLTALGACRDTEQRARHALQVLMQESGARGGYLYGAGAEPLRLLASSDVPPPDAALERAVAAQIAAAERDADDEQTRVESVEGAGIGSSEVHHAGLELRPFVLRSAADDESVVGVVLLAGDQAPPQLSFELLGVVCDGLVRAGDLCSTHADLQRAQIDRDS